MKNTKKGFTLVELLVVIAILAILATVAVVGYTSFTNKAHESNDRTLVAQLNTAVIRVDGKKYESMYEVAEAVKAQGFDVAKMQATAKDHAILWNMKTQKFFYSADEDHGTDNIWIVSDEVSKTYSTYYIGVNEIKIDFAAEICLPTDGTDFTIDAPHAKIYHYGKLANLTIESIAPNSYHEYGTVARATVKEGRVVVENGGNISAVVVDPAEETSTVTLEGSVGHVFATPDALANNLKGEFQAEKVTEVEDVTNVVIGNLYIKETNTYYNSFDEVLASFGAEGYTIVLMKDVAINAPVTIEKTQKVALDLNGFTLSYDSTVMGEAMITNRGTLTINGSKGTGVINYNYTGANDASYGKGNYTISNGGTLTVNGGKITIADLRQHAKYPIDNNSTTGDAILVINGGHLYNYNTSAIRMICNSTTYKNSVTINGGLIEGYSAIWMQNPGSKTVNGDLTITGGEIKTTAKAWVNGTSELKDVSSELYCTTEGGAWSETSFVKISGGIFNENVVLDEKVLAVEVTGGTFNGKCDK